jgi:hypothetical protein
VLGGLLGALGGGPALRCPLGSSCMRAIICLGPFVGSSLQRATNWRIVLPVLLLAVGILLRLHRLARGGCPASDRRPALLLTLRRCFMIFSILLSASVSPSS